MSKASNENKGKFISPQTMVMEVVAGPRKKTRIGPLVYNRFEHESDLRRMQGSEFSRKQDSDDEESDMYTIETTESTMELLRSGKWGPHFRVMSQQQKRSTRYRDDRADPGDANNELMDDDFADLSVDEIAEKISQIELGVHIEEPLMSSAGRKYETMIDYKLVKACLDGRVRRGNEQSILNIQDGNLLAFSSQHSSLSRWSATIPNTETQVAYHELIQSIILRESFLIKLMAVVKNLDVQYWKYAVLRFKANEIGKPISSERLVSKREYIRKIQGELAVAFTHIRSASVHVLDLLAKWRAASANAVTTQDTVSILWQGRNYVEKMEYDTAQLYDYPTMRFWLGFEPNGLMIPPENHNPRELWARSHEVHLFDWQKRHRAVMWEESRKQRRGTLAKSPSKRSNSMNPFNQHRFSNLLTTGGGEVSVSYTEAAVGVIAEEADDNNNSSNSNRNSRRPSAAAITRTGGGSSSRSNSNSSSPPPGGRRKSGGAAGTMAIIQRTPSSQQITVPFTDSTDVSFAEMSLYTQYDESMPLLVVPPAAATQALSLLPRIPSSSAEGDTKNKPKSASSTPATQTRAHSPSMTKNVLPTTGEASPLQGEHADEQIATAPKVEDKDKEEKQDHRMDTSSSTTATAIAPTDDPTPPSSKTGNMSVSIAKASPPADKTTTYASPSTPTSALATITTNNTSTHSNDYGEDPQEGIEASIASAVAAVRFSRTGSLSVTIDENSILRKNGGSSSTIYKSGGSITRDGSYLGGAPGAVGGNRSGSGLLARGRSSRSDLYTQEERSWRGSTDGGGDAATARPMLQRSMSLLSEKGSTEWMTMKDFCMKSWDEDKRTQGVDAAPQFWSNTQIDPVVVEAAAGFAEVFPEIYLIPPLLPVLRDKCGRLSNVIAAERLLYEHMDSLAEDSLVLRHELSVDLSSSSHLENMSSQEHLARSMEVADRLRSRQETDDGQVNGSISNYLRHQIGVAGDEEEEQDVSVQVQDDSAVFIMTTIGEESLSTSTTTGRDRGRKKTKTAATAFFPIKSLKVDHSRMRQRLEKSVEKSRSLIGKKDDGLTAELRYNSAMRNRRKLLNIRSPVYCYGCATKIQAIVRGFLARRRRYKEALRRRMVAAVLIVQSAIRGLLARRIVKAKRAVFHNEMMALTKDVIGRRRAAFVITKFFRIVADTMKKWREATTSNFHVAFREKKRREKQQQKQAQASAETTGVEVTEAPLSLTPPLSNQDSSRIGSNTEMTVRKRFGQRLTDESGLGVLLYLLPTGADDSDADGGDPLEKLQRRAKSAKQFDEKLAKIGVDPQAALYDSLRGTMGSAIPRPSLTEVLQKYPDSLRRSRLVPIRKPKTTAAAAAAAAAAARSGGGGQINHDNDDDSTVASHDVEEFRRFAAPKKERMFVREVAGARAAPRSLLHSHDIYQTPAVGAAATAATPTFSVRNSVSDASLGFGSLLSHTPSISSSYQSVGGGEMRGGRLSLKRGKDAEMKLLLRKALLFSSESSPFL